MVFVLITTMIDTVIVKYSVNSLFVEILLLLVVTLTVIYHIKDAILVIKNKSLKLEKIVQDIENKLPQSAHLYWHIVQYGRLQIW